jgi:peroxiredoxin
MAVLESMKKSLLILMALAGFLHADVDLGQSAPDFTLPNCEGKQTSLSDFKGKVVVLEWTNMGCPFVKKHYGSGNMQKLQKGATDKGVVWISICSSAPGKQGHMTVEEVAKSCSDNGAKATAYLLDEEGKVGRIYGAKRTPEMYVINADGVLVYHGAIDDKKSPDPAEIADAKNYVQAAVNETLAGKPVSVPKTEAYGCSIKYGN